MALKKRKLFRLIWFSIVIVFFIWQWTSYQSRGLAPNIFDDDELVVVKSSDDLMSFIPTTNISQNEIIFFQGGLADPKAYAPLCRKIAEAGFSCHLIKMDWRMPAWDYQKTAELFDLEKGNYILGGHSQGAKMAAQFVYENPGLLKGLFLLGTSHPRDIDLSDRNIPCLKLYAELDGLASVPEVMANKGMLPINTQLIEVKGGNHSQFGYLGHLLTDDEAIIDLEAQQDIMLQHLTSFFKEIETTKKN